MAKRPNDKFESYYAEKLWDMIPSVYRHEDAIAENHGVLRSFIEIIAEQAAILRRSHDRLWEDQFIEFCNDWAVPYIADLVGTRLVSALNSRGRRVDVAKTIYFRRRKGTVRILEELISDLTGWEGKVVENFRRLGRSRHLLEPWPAQFAGRFSGIMPGGWADIRNQRVSELAEKPFDEFYHTPDVRQHRGVFGRYNIPKLAFHLYRLASFKLTKVTPFRSKKEPNSEHKFAFDPSGRDIQLFMPRNRPGNYDWDKWHSASEWELPAPMRCRLLEHAEYEIKEIDIQWLVDVHGLSDTAGNELRSLKGVRFQSENRLRNTLGTLNHCDELLDSDIYIPLLSRSITDKCGKYNLIPHAVQIVNDGTGHAYPHEKVTAGSLDDWTAGAPGKRLVVDPKRGRFRFLGALPPDKVIVNYYYGFSGEIGAGPYDRRHIEDSQPDCIISAGGGPLLAADIENDGITQISDSATYDVVGDKIDIKNVTLRAANFQRPYIRVAANWILSTGANKDGKLKLDGLWFGSKGDYEIILKGDYEQVDILHVTLDPGGQDIDGNVIFPVQLVIEAHVELLEIDASITASIRTRAGGVIENLVIHDSIVHSTDPGTFAVLHRKGEVKLNRVTIFGTMKLHRLWASEILATGEVNVADTQDANGCFRFSAAPESSRLPRPYKPYWIKDSKHYFVSQRFGDAGYAQLSEAAPVEIRCGAENGSEIGAFSVLINPIKLDSLRVKVEEYMPFGLIPIFVQET